MTAESRSTAFQAVEKHGQDARATPKVRLRGVSKRFDTGVGKNARRFEAVKDVSFEVRDGEFLALVGPSGCGKTTILNLIAGFERPDEGEVFFEGRPVTGAGPDRLVIFQEHGLFPWLTVQRNVEFGLRVLGLDKHERRERAMHYLQMVHLTKFRRSYPFQLSGGMRQRTALARALAVEPQVLLMDEPFASLDPRTRDILHVELQSLWLQTHKTIVFVTHSVEEALRLSDRIVVLASQPGRVRHTLSVSLPHPRDFLDAALVEMRANILKEFEDELNILVKKEGDDDWRLEEGSISARPPRGVALGLGDGI
ncbi:MAG: ABC transporter ATP-binding protein [Planctomycetota bacterium]|nr:ABC transporter ATP-binding protein [Planctomycetota bacterium]